MRERCMSGSVRGARGNLRPYRDRASRELTTYFIVPKRAFAHASAGCQSRPPRLLRLRRVGKGATIARCMLNYCARRLYPPYAALFVDKSTSSLGAKELTFNCLALTASPLRSGSRVVRAHRAASGTRRNKSPRRGRGSRQLRRIPGPGAHAVRPRASPNHPRA